MTTCPLCGPAQAMEHDGDHDDLACPECGLCAPADEVERLEIRMARLELLEAEVARLKQPAHVLAEAERLLRAAAVRDFRLHLGEVWARASVWYSGSSPDVICPTLAEAYASIAAGHADEEVGRG